MKDPANLAEKLATFTDRFSPRTVATYNNNDIMVAKLEGPFHWHKHDDTDDFFLVLDGTLDIELRDRTVTLNPGEVFVVPERRRASAGGARRGAYPPDRTDGDAEHRRQSDRSAAHRHVIGLPGFQGGRSDA